MIAAKYGCSRNRVRVHRRSLGLPAVRHSGPISRRMRQASAEWLREAGYSSLAQCRYAKERLAVVLRGWPAGTTERRAQVLEFLATGTKSVLEVAAAMGMVYRPEACKAQQMLASMARDGLLVAGWRRTGKPGRPQRIYRLADSVLAERRQWEAHRGAR
jgi:hypothetical protein